MHAAIFSLSAPTAAAAPPVNSRSIPLKCRQANTIIFDHNISSRPFALSTRKFSRKLICKPPAGKYLSDDYLVKKLSATEVELIKGDRNMPLIIDFYATWCGPCILMAQVLETMMRSILKAAFSVHLGSGTNNMAELKAAIEGLKICQQQGWQQIILETDSQILQSWILGTTSSPWSLMQAWLELQELRRSIRLHVVHRFREGNSIVDFLAKQGANGSTVYYLNAADLPKEIKGIVRIEKWGLPSIRFS